MSRATTTIAVTDTIQRATFGQLVSLVYFSISNMIDPLWGLRPLGLRIIAEAI
jgi:hypothetical protein